MKACKKCGIEKPESDFHPHGSTRDRLRPACKKCTVSQNKNWAKKNPERYAKGISDWWKANPEKLAVKTRRRAESGYFKEYAASHKEQVNARRAAWYENNKERLLPIREKWMAENKEKMRAYYSQWRKDNPHLIRKYNHARRAANISAPGNYTSGEAFAILMAQDHKCANPYCGDDLKIVEKHLDHRVPLANGGSNSIENLQWLCAPCNLSKGSKDEAVWLLSQAEKRRAA